MTDLDRCFPPDQCEPMVGVPRLYVADVTRTGFILDGMEVVNNEGVPGPLAARGWT